MKHLQNMQITFSASMLSQSYFKHFISILIMACSLTCLPVQATTNAKGIAISFITHPNANHNVYKNEGSPKEVTETQTFYEHQYLEKGKNEKNCEIFNIGAGNGVTVLEAIKAFEKIADLSLNYEIGPRRDGDVIAIYANNVKATSRLEWQPKHGIEKIMSTAWAWENNRQNFSYGKG